MSVDVVLSAKCSNKGSLKTYLEKNSIAAFLENAEVDGDLF